MQKRIFEENINKLMSTGADFGEIYYEDTTEKTYIYVNSILDKINYKTKNGLGIRIAKDDMVYYSSLNDLKKNNIDKSVKALIGNINDKCLYKDIKLNNKKRYSNNEKIIDNELNKKTILRKIDQTIRKMDSHVNQVEIKLFESIQKIEIANHTGKFVSEDRLLNRLTISVLFKDGDIVANESYNTGASGRLNILDNLDIDKIAKYIINEGLNKLNAIPIQGGDLPVVIGSGFGAVIFHEACGHALEATAAAQNLSILSNKLNEKIASSVVNLVDDGTIKHLWGTTLIDDEGTKTNKNLLIKEGILNSYLIDEINNRKMKQTITGSSRRESYKFPPTSRMNNTYLMTGKDKFEDMIKSIKYGLYAKELGGGCVSIETGDFNFAVTSGYLIKDGKICDPVKSASLIGNTKDILNNIEMVSDNLEYDVGYCGATSGWVPVTIGQPTIKVKKILVGGENNDK